MSTVELTEQTFDATVTDHEVVLVDWWADWCGPCKQFAPVYEQAARKHDDVVFGKVDTQDQPQLAGGANITSIPTIMAFREGILVFAQPGALPATALESLITQVKDLDMDDVRAQLAAQQETAGAPASGA